MIFAVCVRARKKYTGRDSKKEIDRAEAHYRRQAKNSLTEDLWEFPIDHLLPECVWKF